MVRRLNRRALCCLAALSLAFFLAACSDDDPAGPSDESAPVLPDVSTMSMDLSFFEQPIMGAMPGDEGRPVPLDLAASAGYDNFYAAAIRVAFVHDVFCEALKAPVAAFALAIHSVPQRQGDGSWLWTYICVDNEIEYNIYLYGTNASDRTCWRMEVSTDDPEMPLDHFVWFDGEALRYESVGYWQFYEPMVMGSPLGPPTRSPAEAAETPGRTSVRMDWVNLTGGIHQLTVLDNNTESSSYGDELAFYTSPAHNTISLADASDPTVVFEIHWYADGSGSIQVPDYPAANPGRKVCWDADQLDAICPDA